MANKYAEDIRTIAGIDNLAGGIESQNKKQPINGSRGIAFFNADGTIGSTGGSPGGGSDEPGGGDNGNDGEGGDDGNTGGDGSGGDDTGSTGTIQPDDSFDGGAGSGSGTGDNPGGGGGGVGGSGITYDDGSDTSTASNVGDLFDGTLQLGDKVGGVGGLVDCQTGQEYIIRGDGRFTAPDGWAGADFPPIDPTYEVGFFWAHSIHTAKRATRQAVLDSDFPEKPNVHDLYYWLDDWRVVNVDSFSPYRDMGDGLLNTKVYSYERDYGYSPQPEYRNTWAGNVYQFICDGSYSNNGECNPTEEDIYLESEWPSDTPAQLSYDSDHGAFKTHPLDTNVADKYKQNNVGQLNLCDPEGNQYNIAPANNGGLVFTDTTNNIFIVRNPDGKIGAAGSGSVRDQYVAF